VRSSWFVDWKEEIRIGYKYDLQDGSLTIDIECINSPDVKFEGLCETFLVEFQKAQETRYKVVHNNVLVSQLLNIVRLDFEGLRISPSATDNHS